MVGIILTSHGQLAERVLQSGPMIFGKQENVKTAILKPSKDPDDLRVKLEEAIASFDNQDEVLFLVDLQGGTPFNQSSTLFEERKDKWAIVSGLNLPMLIEAYASRFSVGSAHEIAAHIIETARDGIKVRPEELELAEAPKTAIENAQPKGALPERTVVGDGKTKHVLARVDSRLLHGQVATAWTKAVQPSRIIVVSDVVLRDSLRKRLIEQAAPPGVKANAIPISKMIEVAKNPRFGNAKALLLFGNSEDVLTAVEGGVSIKELNVRSMAHSVGKVVISKVLFMEQEGVEAFEKLEQKSVKFDVRKVPNDSRDSMDDILKKTEVELAKA